MGSLQQGKWMEWISQGVGKKGQKMTECKIRKGGRKTWDYQVSPTSNKESKWVVSDWGLTTISATMVISGQR